MDYLSIIKQPIQKDLDDFIALFNSALTHDDGMLGSALTHIRQRGGKRMRPILMMLMARNFGTVSDVTQHSAVGLELLHTEVTSVEVRRPLMLPIIIRWQSW